MNTLQRTLIFLLLWLFVFSGVPTVAAEYSSDEWFAMRAGREIKQQGPGPWLKEKFQEKIGNLLGEAKSYMPGWAAKNARVAELQTNSGGKFVRALRRDMDNFGVDGYRPEGEDRAIEYGQAAGRAGWDSVKDSLPVVIRKPIEAIESTVAKISNELNEIEKDIDYYSEKLQQGYSSLMGDRAEYEVVPESDALMLEPDEQRYMDQETDINNPTEMPDVFSHEAIEFAREELGLSPEAIAYAEPLDDPYLDQRPEAYDGFVDPEDVPQDDGGFVDLEDYSPDDVGFVDPEDVLQDDDGFGDTPQEDEFYLTDNIPTQDSVFNAAGITGKSNVGRFSADKKINEKKKKKNRNKTSKKNKKIPNEQANSDGGGNSSKCDKVRLQIKVLEQWLPGNFARLLGRILIKPKIAEDSRS